MRLALVALACLLLAAPAAAGPYSNLLAPAGACDASTPQASILCLTNWARTQSGLAPLTANTTLESAGGAKLQADIDCNEFTHTPCGKPFTNVFAAYVVGATSYALGENIAWGTGNFDSPRAAMDAWLNSDGHRANILDPRFTELGVGFLPDRTFLGYTGATLWSQEFGTRSAPTLKQPAPKHAKRPTSSARLPCSTRSRPPKGCSASR